MIVSTNKNNDYFDKIASSFTPVQLSKEDYLSYSRLSEKLFPFLLTKHWVLMVLSKTIKGQDVYHIYTLCTYIKPLARLFSLDDSKMQYRFEILSGETFTEVIMDGNVLSSNGCKELLTRGCLFQERDTQLLLQYLTKACFQAETKKVYTKFGWRSSTAFRSGIYISNQGDTAEYIGQMELKPHGFESVYLNMIIREVLPNVTILFVWLLGFASPILSLLNQSLDLGCLLFNLSNTSSRGKTTAGMLAASVFANPMFNKGTVISCNSTNNALLGFVACNNSHTVILDEIATSDIAGFRKLLYCFCSGRDRMRLNTDGDLRDCKSFDSVIITTAEFPIVDENAPNGIRTRVFEITDDLTISAENSERIKEVVITNYALLGEKFIRFLLTKDIESISADYQTSYTALKEATTKIKVGDLTMRILSKLAVILVTAEYVKECFKFDFDINVIKRFILKLENSIRSETDIAEKALDCILQSVSKNGNRYILGNSDYMQAALGKVYESGCVKTIFILKDEVEHILASNHFDNPKIIFQKWKMAGTISCEKDRYYKRVRLTSNVPMQNCYVFKIKDEKSMFIDLFGRKTQLADEDSPSYISGSSDEIDIEF